MNLCCCQRRSKASTRLDKALEELLVAESRWCWSLFRGSCWGWRSNSTVPWTIHPNKPSTNNSLQHAVSLNTFLDRNLLYIIDLLKSYIHHGSSFRHTIDIITKDCNYKDLQSTSTYMCTVLVHMYQMHIQSIIYTYSILIKDLMLPHASLFAPKQPRDPRNQHNRLAVRHEGEAADPHTSARTLGCLTNAM